ncbi:MAG: hypothetical protein WBE26_03950 [Phycisphaerae bacterium]
MLIATGVRASDCNNNGIEDTDELAVCPAIDLIFLIDTSISTEADIPLICRAIRDAIDDVRQGGLTVNAEILELAPGDTPCFIDEPGDCCTDTVANVYGTKAPCLPEVLGTCGGCNEGDCEDWAPATAIVAANRWWKWGPGPRIIVPVSDGGPRCGGGGEEPSNPINDEDWDAIDHAIYLVWDNRVIVLPDA